MQDENMNAAMAGEPFEAEPELGEWEPGEMVEEASEAASEEVEEVSEVSEEPEVAELFSESQWRARERERDFLSFARAHPEVAAEDIPPEVWRAVAAGSTLSNAWRGHQNNLMRVKLLSMEQAEKNRRRSTGSRATDGASKETDFFDVGWGEM